MVVLKNLRDGSELVFYKGTEQNDKRAPNKVSTGRFLWGSIHLQFKPTGLSRSQRLFLWDALVHFRFTMGAISETINSTHRAIPACSFLVLCKAKGSCPSVTVILCNMEYLHDPWKHRDRVWFTSNCALPCKIIQLVKNPSPSKTSCVRPLSCLAIQFMDQVRINELTQWRHPRGQGCEGKGRKSLQQERGESVVNQCTGGQVNQTHVLGCSRSKEREKLPPTLSQPESRRDFSLFGEL